MNARRISRPAAVRMGMFWRLGSDDDRRPVAAIVCWNEVWMRPVGVGQRRQRVDVGALQLRDLAVLEHAPGQRVPCAASSFRTSTPVENDFVLAVLRPPCSPSFSKRIVPSCTGELTLNSSPASSQIFCSSARRSFSIRPDIAFKSGASIAIPASSMRARTGVSGRSISR